MPTSKSCNESKVGSNAGNVMIVQDARVRDNVKVWNKTITGLEWFIRPINPQPIKGIGESYTKEECTRIILQGMLRTPYNPTVRKLRSRIKCDKKKLEKIKTEVDKKKIQLEKELKQLKNLELEAKIKVSSTEYMLDMVSK